MDGTVINHDTLAFDVIDEVGPNGHFLACDHTMRYFREDWYPNLMDRRNHEDWMAAGRKDLNDRAREKIEEILKNEISFGLSQEIQNKIRAIRERAETSITG